MVDLGASLASAPSWLSVVWLTVLSISVIDSHYRIQASLLSTMCSACNHGRVNKAEIFEAHYHEVAIA